MNIIIFTHPEFSHIRSIRRYTNMLANGMTAKGHIVTIWEPKPILYNFGLSGFMKKWLGYADQYLLFPIWVRWKILVNKTESLYVFADNALGPWVKLVKHKPNVVHCHDLMALESALGKMPDNKTGLSGKLYQKFIWNGLKNASNFISVSEKTKAEISKYFPDSIGLSEVVYNRVNQLFKPLDKFESRAFISKQADFDAAQGYILHLGASVWYKNKIGVIRIYEEWRSLSDLKLPLLLIGDIPDTLSLEAINSSKYKKDIFMLENVNDELINYAFSGACAFLFPSISEGFGLPIAEAMACACIVITTESSPMTEVGGDAAFYLPIAPKDPVQYRNWVNESANELDIVLHLPMDKTEERIQSGLAHVQRFNYQVIIDKIERIYIDIFEDKKEKY